MWVFSGDGGQCDLLGMYRGGRGRSSEPGHTKCERQVASESRGGAQCQQVRMKQGELLEIGQGILYELRPTRQDEN